MRKLMDALNKVYEARKNFIILGLTGRTGSGCTTISSLLENTSFADFNPPKPKNSDFENDEERKYRVLYNFLSEQWVRFEHIKLSSIVTTFILDLDFKDFADLCKDKLLIGQYNVDFDGFESVYQAAKKKRDSLKKDADETGNISDSGLYDFYFSELVVFTEKIRAFLNGIKPDAFTEIYQFCGNNVRSSGSVLESGFIVENMYSIPKRVNKFIKVLRRSCNGGSPVCVVLDAIRNPYEAFFFRERYSAFYLVSVNCEDDDRKDRLISQRLLSLGDIEKIDERENPRSLGRDQRFWSLDQQRCIEISDIHIYNKNDSARKSLKKQLVKYISLIMHPGLVTPSQDERCMHIAFNAKLNSGCLSRQVGAVVTDSWHSIKSVGWNNVAQGQTPCCLRRAEDLIHSEDEGAYSEFEKGNNDFKTALNKAYSKVENDNFCGKPKSFCFKDVKNSIDGEKNQVHTRSLHAEENAFLQISKYGGQSLIGGKLYTTASPCELCAKKAYQLKIDEIVYIDPYPGVANDHIIKCGTSIPKLKLFHGAIGRAYQQLFEPIIPYKDELEIGLDISFPNKKKVLLSENGRLLDENNKLKKEIERLREQLQGG